MPPKNPVKPKATARKRAAPVRATEPTNGAKGAARSRARVVVPVVGIGASAGGLEALEQFLAHVPPASGFAFVIVQHLDPTHRCIMPELLQRITAMKVTGVADRTRVRPDCVYVIPPNRDLSLLHGVLHLFEPAKSRGLRLPIDFFFRSLAADRRQESIGVILSGMGSDGTLGLKEIKEQAGFAFVQEPGTARFADMPQSAIRAGVADVVARPEELPGRLVAIRQSAPRGAALPPADHLPAEGELEKVLLLIRNQTSHDFSHYKHTTILRRIDRRMRLHQISKLAHYVRFLRENPNEATLLFKELLIGVTAFFRDGAVWDELRDRVLPELLKRHPAGRPLRAWVPACATGEEAFSLAMVLREAIEHSKVKGRIDVQIFATDLNHDAIELARSGLFPAGIAAAVSPARLERFFRREEHGYRINKEIREMVIFAPQNVIMDPPFTKLDLLSCRNLLIYLTAELQRKLLPLFHFSLNPGGILVLGSAEGAAAHAALFKALPGKTRLFRRLEGTPRAGRLEFPSSFSSDFRGNGANTAPASRPASAGLQAQAEQWLLQDHAPAAALINPQGDILYLSGQMGRFLKPVAGKANWNLFVMAPEELRYELTGALHRATQTRTPIVIRGLRVGDKRKARRVDLTIQALDKPAALRGQIMVILADSPLAPAKPTRGDRTSADRTRPHAKTVRHLERALQQARENEQNIREQMQASEEELRSMNEELQSTNEELQSGNEELSTSKEEMQSLTEELQTVNAELQAKVDELSAASSDMRNLLNSTEIATIFLDGELRIRRYTEQASKIIHLIPGDVGRPLTDLASTLLYPEMANDARHVLGTLLALNKRITSKDGHPYAVRLMPYRTLDNRIDGVVITFTDSNRGLDSRPGADRPEPDTSVPSSP